MPILELERIGFQYGEKRVLQDVTLTVEKGEFFGVLGPNGSGKSTLLNLIDGIRLPCEGEIRLKGIAPGKMQRRDVARLVAVVPQEASWVFPLTVEEVVLMGRTPHIGRLAFESERDLAVARSAMEATDILPFAARLMEALSGGERQMLAIGRALMSAPKLIMVDEPSLGLAPIIVNEIFEILCRLNKEGYAILLSEQNAYKALKCAHRGYVLETGSVTLTGTAEQLLADPGVREAYLGA